MDSIPTNFERLQREIFNFVMSSDKKMEKLLYKDDAQRLQVSSPCLTFTNQGTRPNCLPGQNLYLISK